MFKLGDKVFHLYRTEIRTVTITKIVRNQKSVEYYSGNNLLHDVSSSRDSILQGMFR